MAQTLLLSTSSMHSGGGNITTLLSSSEQRRRCDSHLPLATELVQKKKRKVSGKDEKIRLNVGGFRHEIMASTIAVAPDTRLYWTIQKKDQSPNYDPETNEYFIDRNPLYFPYILNFYRLRKVHCPLDVCGSQFEEELQYWGIDECYIDSCCWERYRKYKDPDIKLGGMDDASEHVEQSLPDDIEIGIQPTEENQNSNNRLMVKVSIAGKFKDKFKRKLWSTLEDPNSNNAAQVCAVMSLFFILVSVITFCLETLPYFEVPGSTQKNAIFGIEVICITWFTLEFVCRLWSCPSKVAFLKDVMNWIDLGAIIPFYISVSFSQNFETIVVIRVVRLIRVFRILKLSRHSFGLQILGYTLKASCRELCLLGCFLSIGVVIFSSLIYYAEKDEPNSKFTSIPTSFWWAVVTMTTVGYGDMAPETTQGKMIGAICALSGVLVVALPVPVVVSNFSLFYSHAQSKLRSMKNANQIEEVGKSIPPCFLPQGFEERDSFDSVTSNVIETTSGTPVKTATPCNNFLQNVLAYHGNYSPGSTYLSWRSSLPTTSFNVPPEKEGRNSKCQRNLPVLEGNCVIDLNNSGITDCQPERFNDVTEDKEGLFGQFNNGTWHKQQRVESEYVLQQVKPQQGDVVRPILQSQKCMENSDYFTLPYITSQYTATHSKTTNQHKPLERSKRCSLSAHSSDSISPLLKSTHNITADYDHETNNDHYLSLYNDSCAKTADFHSSPPSSKNIRNVSNPTLHDLDTSVASNEYDHRYLSPLFSSSKLLSDSSQSVTAAVSSSPKSDNSLEDIEQHNSLTNSRSSSLSSSTKKLLRRRNAIRYTGSFEKSNSVEAEQRECEQHLLSRSVSLGHAEQSMKLKEVSKKLDNYLLLEKRKLQQGSFENSPFHAPRAMKKQSLPHLSPTTSLNNYNGLIQNNASVSSLPMMVPTLSLQLPSETSSPVEDNNKKTIRTHSAGPTTKEALPIFYFT